MLCEDFAGWLKDIQSGTQYIGQCSHLPNGENLEVAIVRYYWLRVGGAGPVSLLPAEAPSYAN